MFGKKLIVLLTFASIFINTSSPIAQSSKPDGARQRPQPVSPGNALGSAWTSGTLPLPMTLPPGNTDEVAAALARRVAAKGSDAVPALMEALQLSGFFVTDRAGKVIITPDNKRGQGLLIEGWEVASAAKMLGDGRAIQLTEVSDQLRLIKQLKAIDVGEYLLDGIRTNAENTTNPYLRIWARFIVELGKASPTKYDMTRDDASKVMLDPVQHLLIMRRLYGDVFGLAQKYKDAAGQLAPPVRTGGPAAAFADEQIDPKLLEEVMPGAVALAPVGNNPCKLEGDQPTAMDAGATVIGYGFGKLTGYLESQGSELIGKYAELVGIANILLAYAKFLQTYASLETKVWAEGRSPLIRTKNALPGGRKTIKAQLRMNLGNWPMYNCFRILIGLKTGIDFATLNDGPLGGVGLTWVLDEGGAKDSYNNREGFKGDQQIVGFTQDGKRIQDKGANAKNIGNGTYTKTDDEGMASIILEGTPQRNAKIGAVMPIMKNAHVRTIVRMKAGDIKGDAVDAVGQALGGLAGLATMPLELLYRTDWISIGEVDVPVKDWEECKGRGWHGAISYRRTYTESSSETKPYQQSSSRTTTSYEASIEAFPDQQAERAGIDKMGAFQQTGDKASGTVKVSGTVQMSGRGEASYEEKTSLLSTSYKEDFCRFTLAGGKDKTGEKCTHTVNIQVAGGGPGEGQVSLAVAENRYSFSFFLPKLKTTMSRLIQDSCTGGCVQKKPQSISDGEERELDEEDITVDDQVFDPENPDSVEGHLVRQDGNITEEITWVFSRCS